uniref:Sema domain-containing protein n=1 Tax=Mola mola TaxID=94237 RepID=A0A3Q3X4B2_MOLML
MCHLYSGVSTVAVHNQVPGRTGRSTPSLCMWIQTQAASGRHACASAPRTPVDFTVKYSLTHFQAHGAIQNLAVSRDAQQREVFVACRNAIQAVSSAMEKIWEVKTGPVGSPDCETCRACDIETDPGDPHGICYFIDSSSPQPEPQCLYKKEQNSPSFCPDCLASPLGTKVTIVEQAYTMLFFVAASVNDKVVQRYPRRSVSVMRPLSTEDGFHMVMSGLTVLPSLRNSYKIDYIYSFSSKDHVYFLSLQREDPLNSNSAFQTRLGRLPTLIPEVWMYREVVLECRYDPKRRRRRREAYREVVYNGLQAAHLGRAGKDLMDELRVDEREDILFGVFAVVDERGDPEKNSALCAFPLTKVNHAIDMGVEACCQSGTEQLSRGLSHFQPPESCNVTCSDKATLVAQPYYRLDLFNRKMRNVLFTAVLVTINGNHTLGHFGTSDGRILQVAIFQRMSMFKVPSAGPGCAHFMTCSTCLKAPRFMNCGWCSGVCSRKLKCASRWNTKSCAPVIMEFFPKVEPVGCETELTLCGWEFQSPLRPAIINRKTHSVTVGSGTICNVLPKKSNSEPSITELRPDHGPVYGGTSVTLTGRYLDSGLQRDVFLATQMTAAFTHRTNSLVPLKVIIDNVHVTTTKMFFYRENPIITSVHPQCGFQR